MAKNKQSYWSILKTIFVPDWPGDAVQPEHGGPRGLGAARENGDGGQEHHGRVRGTLHQLGPLPLWAHNRNHTFNTNKLYKAKSEDSEYQI